MRKFKYPFNPTWYDNNSTCEPCPRCQTMLSWGQYYDAKRHQEMRHLICRGKGCDYRSKKITPGEVKGHTPREWLYTRER